MVKNTRIGALGVLTLCGVFGCAGGGQGSPAGGDGGASPSGTSDQAFYADFCAAVAPCCATNGMSANAAVCKASVSRLGPSRDVQVRSACLDELRQKSAVTACMPDVVDLGDACARLFNEPSGSVGPGGACQTTADCAGSSGKVTLCTDAVCATLAPGGMGDAPCLGTQFSTGILLTNPIVQGGLVGQGFLCQKRGGLFCDFSDHHCKALQPGGAACTDSDGCQSRVCNNGSEGGGAGTCLSLPGAGDDCTLDCAGDSYCDRATCVPKLAAGSACTRDVQCSGSCAGADLCSGTCTNGSCQPTVPEAPLDVWCGLTPNFP